MSNNKICGTIEVSSDKMDAIPEWCGCGCSFTLRPTSCYEGYVFEDVEMELIDNTLYFQIQEKDSERFKEILDSGKAFTLRRKDDTEAAN